MVDDVFMDWRIVILVVLFFVAMKLCQMYGHRHRQPTSLLVAPRPGWVTTKDGREFWMPPKELQVPDLLWLRAQAVLFQEAVPVAWPRALQEYDQALEDPLAPCPDDHVYDYDTLGCIRCGISIHDDHPARRRWDLLIGTLK